MRSVFTFFVSLLLFFVVQKPVSASIVDVTKEGEIRLNVLSEQIALDVPQSESLVVNSVVDVGKTQKKLISLNKSDEGMSLNIQGNQPKKLDVTKYQGEVIQLEERPKANKVSIGILGDKFSISEAGFSVVTDYEIKVDPDEAKIFLVTPTGNKYISIFPKEAIESLVRSKTISSTTHGITLIEELSDTLTYKVVGERNINLFNIIEYPIELTAYVSASNGEVIKIDQPVWLPIVSFLFS